MDAYLHRELKYFDEIEEHQIINDTNGFSDETQRAVKQLLAHLAWFNTKIQKRIAHELPNLWQALLHQLCPRLIRPIPSTIILQCTTTMIQNAGSVFLPKGTTFLSQPLGNEKINCPFQVCMPVEILPLTLEKFWAKPNSNLGMSYFLKFNVKNKEWLNGQNLKEIKLFFTGETEVALLLYQAFCHKLKGVIIHVDKQPPKDLGKVIYPAHLTGQDSLMPTSEQDIPAHHLLFDFMVLKEKYLFSKIESLDQISWTENTTEFTIEIISDICPSNYHTFSTDNIKINCTPAVNLFNADCEPVLINHSRYEYPIRISNKNGDGENLIYAITRVVGTDVTSCKKHEYHNFSNCKQGDNQFQFYLEKKKEQYRALIRISQTAGSYESSVLSCEAIACNGYLPEKFIKGKMSFTVKEDVGEDISAINMTKPSRVYVPNLTTEDQCKFIGYLSLNYKSITHITTFKQLLEIFSQIDSSRPLSQSVAGIQHKPLHLCQAGVVYHGIDLTVELEEKYYIGKSDIYFLETFYRHFCAYLSLAITA